VCDAIAAIKAQGRIVPDASLGILDERTVLRLKAAGLQGYNHNLETSRRFFPNLCTTHTYEDRVETIRLCKRHGLFVCSGGIVGMGETDEDRADLVLALRELDVATGPRWPRGSHSPRPSASRSRRSSASPSRRSISASAGGANRT
jgi:biotin synthase